MAVTLFVISAVFLVWTTLAVVRWCPREGGVRYWVCVAAVNLHLTIAVQVSSLFHALTPVGFLITQAVMTLLTVLLAPRIARRVGAELGPVPRPALAILRWPGWRENWGLTALLAVGVLVILGFSLTEQMRRPIEGWDERMYNCSRVLHWIQHGHIWAWITNNDAQVDFPIGSEVFLTWPLLFIKLEWPARLVFWMGYPCAVAGVYLLSRMIGARRAAGLAAAAVFASTPTVILQAGISQKQDIWTAAMFTGLVFWMLRGWRRGDRLSAWMSACAFVLAVNVKITVVVAAPLFLLVAMAPRDGWRAIGRRIAVMTVAGLVTMLASGLAFTVTHNFKLYGHPFGPKEASRVIGPDWTAKQVYAHAIRAPLFLLELPSQPSPEFGRQFSDRVNDWLYNVDAHRRLPQERFPGWPGVFTFDAPHRAARYSLGGTLFMVVLVWGGLSCLKRIVRFRKGRPLPDAAVVALISGVQFVALVFLIRWMGGGPDRYWMVPYAAGIAASVACMDVWARRWKALVLPALALLAWIVVPSLQSTNDRLRWYEANPFGPDRLDSPFMEIISKLEPGARIFLIGNRDCHDYPLFLPRKGYSAQVWPWGRMPFDAARLEKLLDEHQITHAVFQRDDAVGFHWYKGIRVEPFVKWFGERKDFREIKLATPGQRLYVREMKKSP